MGPFTPRRILCLKKSVIASLVAAQLLQSVAAAQVVVVNSFLANRGPGYRKPNPDAAGAVGPRHTAVLDDRAFVVQDKATGKVLRDDTQHEFWLKVLPAKAFDLQANDPRLLYDPIMQRWFAWVQGLKPAHGYLAVSATPDPTGEWRGAKMPFPPHNYGARIGFDRNGLYISVHNGSCRMAIRARPSPSPPGWRCSWRASCCWPTGYGWGQQRISSPAP